MASTDTGTPADQVADNTVEYEIKNTSDFQNVTVTFDHASSPGPRTSTDKPTGSVNYVSSRADGEQFDITIEVYANDGSVADSTTVNDPAVDGTDP